MSISADILLERIQLKSQVRKWRNLFIFVIFATSLLFYTSNDISVSGDHIVSIDIGGIILEDRFRDKKLEAIRKDDNVKAVIININSPGGTMVGGESLYDSIVAISNKKPVIAVLGSIATSGGYMAAIGANHIIARKGTITGSIGVIMQTAEFTELSKKLGINLITLKSGSQKGAPSPFEKLSSTSRRSLQSTINSMHDIFIDMVVQRRPLTKTQVTALANGKVFNGLQALDKKLIDGIGGRGEALKWLKEHKNISDLPVKEREIVKNKNGILGITAMIKNVFSNPFTQVDTTGAMAIWN